MRFIISIREQELVMSLGKINPIHGCYPYSWRFHYSDVIMGAIASPITSLTIVYSTVYSGADQRKHQSSASQAFVREIHRASVNSPHKGPVTRKMFHLMTSSCSEPLILNMDNDISAYFHAYLWRSSILWVAFSKCIFWHFTEMIAYFTSMYVIKQRLLCFKGFNCVSVRGRGRIPCVWT